MLPCMHLVGFSSIVRLPFQEALMRTQRIMPWILQEFCQRHNIVLCQAQRLDLCEFSFRTFARQVIGNHSTKDIEGVVKPGLSFSFSRVTTKLTVSFHSGWNGPSLALTFFDHVFTACVGFLRGALATL